ncbi:MAG: alpha/beta hydrolase [Pseudomonadota bacterium]|nr:alpha/beta hydrolase [Pseudomonadota bacterium]
MAGQTVNVGGAALHVQTMGDADARPLIFLHGGAGNLADFEGIFPDLDEFNCVFIDTRGHGRSTLGRETMSYPRLADDVQAVIEQLDLNQPVVFGHADGGTVALELAARGHGDLAGIITLGAHAWRPSDSVFETYLGRITPELWRRKYPGAAEEYEAANPDGDFNRFFTQLSGMWRNVADGNYPGDKIRQIRCPALILGGEHDHFVSVDETIEIYRAIPTAHLGIIPYASHMVHAEQPDHISPFICDFMLFLDDRETPQGAALIPQTR